MSEQTFNQSPMNAGNGAQMGEQTQQNATQANFNATQPEAMPNASMPEQSKKNNTVLYIVIAAIVVFLIGGGTYFFVSHNSASEEEMAYEILENNDNPQDYRDFLDKYPKSEHAQEVQERLVKLEEMLAKWNAIALSENVNDFVNFKNTYSDAQYGRLCNIKIDSLDFIMAQKVGSPEAYQRYLDAHPDGRYASEASIAQGSLKDQEINEDDLTQVSGVLTDFFNGFAAQDESHICSNIASTMTTFLNKRNANKATVLNAIKAMFNEHIESCQFTVNRDLQVKRNTNGFVVNFTVDQHIERDDEGKTFGQYKCVAELSNQMLITSLTMQEISKN